MILTLSPRMYSTKNERISLVMNDAPNNDNNMRINDDIRSRRNNLYYLRSIIVELLLYIYSYISLFNYINIESLRFS